MKKEYDFSKAKRGAVLPTTGKTRITLYLDNEVLEHFRTLSEKTGRGYQTLINETLSAAAGRTGQMLTPEAVRHIVREELALLG
ncbi:MAG: BrnA antitoxin family protein [Deltaproteobacteria bacterium]|nr:BrnA antitoxin family protein [Deltaproteobacteria bacterium]